MLDTFTESAHTIIAVRCRSATSFRDRFTTDSREGIAVRRTRTAPQPTSHNSIAVRYRFRRKTQKRCSGRFTLHAASLTVLQLMKKTQFRSGKVVCCHHSFDFLRRWWRCQPRHIPKCVCAFVYARLMFPIFMRRAFCGFVCSWSLVSS